MVLAPREVELARRCGRAHMQGARHLLFLVVGVRSKSFGVSVLPSVKWGDYTSKSTTQKRDIFHLKDYLRGEMVVVLGGGSRMDLKNCQQSAPHENSRVTKRTGRGGF